MSIECGECERDLRGGHAPSCSRYIRPAVVAHIEALEAERDRLKQVVRQGRDLISGEAVGPEWKRGCNAFLEAACAALKGEGE